MTKVLHSKTWILQSKTCKYNNRRVLTKREKHRIQIDQNYLTCNVKRCPINTLILFEPFKNLHPHLSALSLNLNLTIKSKSAHGDLLSFSKTKKQIILREIFFRSNQILFHLNWGIEIYLVNNLNHENMETKF